MPQYSSEREFKGNLRRVPIVALTGHADKGRCILCGMDDYLQKPALLNDFKRMIDKWVLADGQ